MEAVKKAIRSFLETNVAEALGSVICVFEIKGEPFFTLNILKTKKK